MKILHSTIFISLLTLAAQLFSAIPEAPLRLIPFYLSSQQSEVKMKLAAPAAIAVARSGNMYVFDDGNSRIVKLDPRGNFISEFGQAGSAGAVKRAGFNASIAVDQNENVYVSDPVTPKVSIFSPEGTLQRSFRIPFPMTSIAVNRKQEIFLAIDTSRHTELIYVFTDTGKFLRRFGERLVRPSEGSGRAINMALIACDANENLFVTFRSWPLIRKYSPAGTLISENQFKIPAELISESQRNGYSLDFFSKHADSSFVPPLITHSISLNRAGTGYLLLNAHSIVVFAPSGEIQRQFHFRAPRDRNTVFLRLVGDVNSRKVYLLDTRSGEVYEAPKL